MVLRYWGERGITAESFAALVDRSAAGIRTTTLIGDLQRRGFQATGIAGTDATLGGELAAGRPAIALIEDRPGAYHYVVVVGVTGRAVVFHDPARAPLRVMARSDFERRWNAADRWMAVILPPPAATASSAPPPPAVPPVELPADADACTIAVARGVAEAQGNELDAAERTLSAAALACPGSPPLRELAGVRALQRRWDDVVALASAATAAEPDDQYAWRLLATGRFLSNDVDGALAAWNAVGEPRLDLVRVNGLERTRQRPVETLMGLRPGVVLTPNALRQARRRLSLLPAASSSNLEVAPVPGGLAEARAAIAEEPLVPRDAWSFAFIGVRAALNRTVSLTLGSPTGGGDALRLDWRFWPDRERVAASYRTPAPWGGTWGVDAAGQTQGFTAGVDPRRRTSGRLVVANWVRSTWLAEARAGADRWRDDATFAATGATIGFRSAASRFDARLDADAWSGSRRFAVAAVSLAATSSRARTGLVIAGATSVAHVTGAAPPDLWVAGDTGHAQAYLLRAHPVLDGGQVRTERIGRTLLHGSAEGQYWWSGSPLVRAGAVAFVDMARTTQRQSAGALDDVDVGLGFRLTTPLMPGVVRIDLARGLRDGSTALSARYVID